MEVQDVIDLGRDAVITTLLISSPVLLAGLIVGLLIGLLQAVTQVQDQTVAFVPKLIAMVGVLALSLPWLLTITIEYIRRVIEDIPGSL